MHRHRFFAALLVFPVVVGAQAIDLRPGLVISSSVRIIPKTYRFAAPASLDSAVITIRGDDVTVDFQGAVLEGLDPAADPDRASGVGIRVVGGRNVRIINARIRGYKVGILARGTRGLDLIDNDLSYNWKPRLFSLVEHESLVDWMSFHHNEKDEWLRFGAAIYLSDVKGGTISGNRAVQGSNGLLVVRSDSLSIRDNEFSFNSALGIGMYRSSHDTIIHNRLDYNVRGYSHGFYRRGQDSADLLMYEQSSHNVVACNSATHGGDGLFLWAGQTTMDSGTGGANDNLFYRNDFSYAPANGIEATFSRNTFVANRIVGNEYGVWGGYSFESVIYGNTFEHNRTGIAIEHGQDNAIVGNTFLGDSTAIRLWSDSIEPSDWGYPKYRDTRSRDYRIVANSASGGRVALRVANTRNLGLRMNVWEAESVFVLRDNAGFEPYWMGLVDDVTDNPRFDCVIPVSDLSRRDRSAIIVDEWGPYDWQSPKLWPIDSTRANPLRLAVLGPPGTWRVIEQSGIASLSRTSGKMGDTITLSADSRQPSAWQLTLEYRGPRSVSPRGLRTPAGYPVRFSYERFEPPVAWSAQFFSWTDTANFFATPIHSLTAPRLDWMWYRPMIQGLPREHIALKASGTVTLPEGAYSIRTISDDAVRVWVDGQLVIDNWTPHESAVDAAPLSGGRHEVRVEYVQVGGWTELRVEILKGAPATSSTGSPGPH